MQRDDVTGGQQVGSDRHRGGRRRGCWCSTGRHPSWSHPSTSWRCCRSRSATVQPPMSRTVSPRVGSDGQPFPSRVAVSSSSTGAARPGRQHAPSATDGASRRHVRHGDAQPRRGVDVDGVHAGAHLVQPELGAIWRSAPIGPQHVPDHLGFGQLPVERVVVILGAIPDVSQSVSGEGIR